MAHLTIKVTSGEDAELTFPGAPPQTFGIMYQEDNPLTRLMSEMPAVWAAALERIADSTDATTTIELDDEFVDYLLEAFQAITPAPVVIEPPAPPPGPGIALRDRSILRKIISDIGIGTTPFQNWVLGSPGNVALGVDNQHEHTGREWLEMISHPTRSGGFSCGDMASALFRLISTGNPRSEKIIGPRGGKEAAGYQEFTQKALNAVDRLTLDLQSGHIARVVVGPHAFLVEPIGEGECLIHQSYDGAGGHAGFELEKSVTEGQAYTIEALTRWLKTTINWEFTVSPPVATEQTRMREEARQFRQQAFFDHSVDPTGQSGMFGRMHISISTRPAISPSQQTQLVDEIITKFSLYQQILIDHEERMDAGIVSHYLQEIESGIIISESPFDPPESPSSADAGVVVDASYIHIRPNGDRKRIIKEEGETESRRLPEIGAPVVVTAALATEVLPHALPPAGITVGVPHLEDAEEGGHDQLAAVEALENNDELAGDDLLPVVAAPAATTRGASYREEIARGRAVDAEGDAEKDSSTLHTPGPEGTA